MSDSESTAKLVSELAEQFIADITMKRIETGYADNQPKWPYWVRPCNYSESEWWNMDQWIVDTMGESDWSVEHARWVGDDWSVEHARWVGSDQKYWFRDERDRTLFLLKWS